MPNVLEGPEILDLLDSAVQFILYFPENEPG